MASINDFKILNSSCLNYFNLANETQGFNIERVSRLTDLEKMRFGFYYFILNKLSDIDEFDDITKCICDQDFLKKLYNDGESDEGIDAVYIDDSSSTISLFNFKFRSKFNADKQQSKDEAILSSKFLNVIQNENNRLKGKLGDFASEIIKRYNSQVEWNTNFYIVSNENKELSVNDPNLAEFSELYDVNIETIGLSTITELMLPSHKKVSSSVNLPTDAVMSYAESALSSNISYIVHLRLTDLIRITCDDENLRMNDALEEEGQLANVKENREVLFDNVRGLLLKSKYNRNIEYTLTKEPSKFFFYNNGITIVAEDIDYKELNSGRRARLVLKDFQVLNGGQTLRTVHLFNQKNPKYISDNLSKAEILVRILKVTEEPLKNKIGEYTNSQNAIKQSDLKALRKEQLELDTYLADHDILYVRKRGDVIQAGKDYKWTIGMERLGQILLAVQGYPEFVSNKKKEIFTTRYEDLFGTPDIISETTVDLIKDYNEIKKSYKSTPFDVSDQKIMYILYIKTRTGEKDIKGIIKNFESCVMTFLEMNQLQLAPSRIMILPKFKEQVNKRFEIRA